MIKPLLMKAKIYRLGWNGVKLNEEEVQDLPLEALTIDSWFSPQIGELCLNDKNELDVVKNIYFKPSDGTFKARNVYEFENSESKCSENMVTRIEVQKGRVFIFGGKVFVHQEPLDGGYIDQIAKKKPITDYEYSEFDIKAS